MPRRARNNHPGHPRWNGHQSAAKAGSGKRLEVVCFWLVFHSASLKLLCCSDQVLQTFCSAVHFLELGHMNSGDWCVTWPAVKCFTLDLLPLVSLKQQAAHKVGHLVYFCGWEAQRCTQCFSRRTWSEATSRLFLKQVFTGWRIHHSGKRLCWSHVHCLEAWQLCTVLSFGS